MNCFQHIPESRGAIAQPPRGGATKKKADPTTQHALIGFKHPHLPQPSALHNRTCPCPLTSDRTRNARAPTSPRSIGFCAIWGCISTSSGCHGGGESGYVGAALCCSHRRKVHHCSLGNERGRRLRRRKGDGRKGRGGRRRCSCRDGGHGGSIAGNPLGPHGHEGCQEGAYLS